MSVKGAAGRGAAQRPRGLGFHGRTAVSILERWFSGSLCGLHVILSKMCSSGRFPRGRQAWSDGSHVWEPALAPWSMRGRAQRNAGSPEAAAAAPEEGEEGVRTDVSRPQAWRQCYCQRPRLLEGSRFVRGPFGGPSSLVGGASRFCFSTSPCLFSSLPGPVPRVPRCRATSSSSPATPQVPAASAAGATAAPAPLLRRQVLAGTCAGQGC